MSKPWIALFRGINVGGNNKLPMKELAARMVENGLTDVKTYIASGNVVFRAPGKEAALQERIETIVQRSFGFRPAVFVLAPKKLESVIEGNPFKDAAHQGKAQHVFFLAAPATSVDHALLDGLKTGEEAYAVTDDALYLYAPEGIGQSKLAEKIARAVKATMTARNLNTVLELSKMVAALGKLSLPRPTRRPTSRAGSRRRASRRRCRSTRPIPGSAARRARTCPLRCPSLR